MERSGQRQFKKDGTMYTVLVVAPSGCICKNLLGKPTINKDGSVYFHHSIDISYSNLHHLTKSHSNKSPVGKLGECFFILIHRQMSHHLRHEFWGCRRCRHDSGFYAGPGAYGGATFRAEEGNSI